jgi:hypothetical protein
MEGTGKTRRAEETELVLMPAEENKAVQTAKRNQQHKIQNQGRVDLTRPPWIPKLLVSADYQTSWCIDELTLHRERPETRR